MTALSRKESSSSKLVYYSNEPTQSPPRRLVLCIPGLGTSGSDYLPLLEALVSQQPQNLYIAVDTPGQGGSPALPQENPSVPTLVKPITQLYDETAHPEKGLVFIGHSMGCRLALEAFSQHHANVSAVILLEGNWNGTLQQQPPLPSVADLPPKDVAQKYMLTNLETLFGPNTPSDFKDEQRKLVMEADLPYQAQLLVANRRWDGERMIEALQQIRTVNERDHAVQLLLIQSMDSASTPRRALKNDEETSWMKIAREYAGNAYSGLVITDSGHWPQIDKTNEVAEAIIPLIS